MSDLEQEISRYRSYLSKIEEREVLFTLASSVFENSDYTIRWLLTPQPGLDHKPPINCVEDIEKELLLAIEHVIY